MATQVSSLLDRVRVRLGRSESWSVIDPYNPAFDKNEEANYRPDPHPLHVARAVVDRVLFENNLLLAKFAAQANIGLLDAQRLIRVTALQVLCHVGNARCMAEQLSNNAAYRWFVGLQCVRFGGKYAGRWVLENILPRSTAAKQIMQQLIADEGWQTITQDEYFSPNVNSPLSWCDGGRQDGETEDDIGPDRFAKVREYVMRNIEDEDLSVDDIAFAVHVSRRTLYHICSKRGTTPARLVRQVRLERAYAEINDPENEDQITVIAFDCGFNDCSRFSRLFKARFGLSPKDLRRGAQAPAKERQRA